MIDIDVYDRPTFDSDDEDLGETDYHDDDDSPGRFNSQTGPGSFERRPNR